MLFNVGIMRISQKPKHDVARCERLYCRTKLFVAWDQIEATQFDSYFEAVILRWEDNTKMLKSKISVHIPEQSVSSKRDCAVWCPAYKGAQIKKICSHSRTKCVVAKILCCLTSCLQGYPNEKDLLIFLNKVCHPSKTDCGVWCAACTISNIIQWPICSDDHSYP